MTPEAEPHTLSSAQTLYMKLVLPVVWVGLFSTATLSLFMSPESWDDASGEPFPSWMKWLFLVFTLFGIASAWWFNALFKRVRMDDRSLYISNYFKEVVVPLANVAEVTENRWTNIHPVTVRFHSDTPFGSRITFMPKFRWFDFWSSHPVVEEIRAAARRVRTPRRNGAGDRT